MKYCFYCGNLLEDDDKFCSKCGNLQENEEEINASNTQSNAEQAKSKKIEMPFIVVILSVAAVVVLAIVLIYFFALKDNGEGGSSYNDNQDGYEDEYGYDAAYLGDYGYDEYADDFYFYDSTSRYLSYEEVSYLDEDGCQHAINEIYARHGRNFSEEPYNSYFNSCEWYQPIYSGDEFDESVFNDYEKKNLLLLVNYRKELAEMDDWEDYDE